MAFLVAPSGGLESLGGDEETTRCEWINGGGNTGFKPMVEIGDGQGEPGVVDGDKVTKPRQVVIWQIAFLMSSWPSLIKSRPIPGIFRRGSRPGFGERISSISHTTSFMRNAHGASR
jgi:hypothetical protein